eukprot:1184823-Prorocentrum_minimum.AAC.1
MIYYIGSHPWSASKASVSSYFLHFNCALPNDHRKDATATMRQTPSPYNTYVYNNYKGLVFSRYDNCSFQVHYNNKEYSLTATVVNNTDGQWRAH